ncbi:unnamed protein product [Rhodiola kirilowii]
MKRSREDGQPGSQPKRPASDVPVGSDGQTLTTNDALSYLKAVRDAFKDNTPKYEQFLEVMKEFKSDRIGTVGVIERVKELFQGHPDLILGFNTFLPVGYEIKLPLEEPVKKPAEFKEAIRFVNKIKIRFRSDDHIYKSFLEILNLYRKEHKSISEVHREVFALFHDHPDLLAEFAQFLPDNTVTEANNYAASTKKVVLHERNLATPTLNVEKERANGLLVDHGRETDTGRVSKFENGRKPNEKNRDGREGGHDSKDFELEDRKGLNMQQLASNHSNALKIEREGVFHQEILFCEEVKKRMHRPAEFPQFLKCLHIYSKDIITRKELENLVADFIGRESDILARFPDFLTHCKNIDEFLAFYSSHQQHNEENGVSFRDWDREPRERDRYDITTEPFNKDNMGQRVHSYPSKDKYIAKPVSELDLSNCERCTPSYRLLPADFPIPIASQRPTLAAHVLNDHWVSVTSGSEDYSFKHMRKNQYEESLFRCEDDRFELDMLLESVNVTIRRVEELLAKIDSHKIMLGEPLRIEEHLNALNLRTIDRLYGDHALDVMEVLKKNAALALPVVYTRLKQKQEEWIRCRADFNKVWAEIYSKNYHKSLDHRSFYFKQQDTKSLSTKALLLEIKELSENSCKNDDMMSALEAWNRRPLKPDLSFEYPDPDIHEDLYQLVKYSCGEVCTTEQYEKAMKIWTFFLEPLIGVPPRPDEPEDSEDAGNTKEASPPTSDSDCNPEDDSVKDSKQASPVKTGDAPELSSSRRGWSVDRVKTDGSNLDPHRCKSDSASASYRLARVQHDAVIANNISGTMKQICLNEGRIDSSFSVGEEENKKNMGTASDGLTSMSRRSSSAVNGGSILKPSNGAVCSTEVIIGERTDKDSGFDRHHEESARHGEADREEGELSPTGDFGEDNFLAYVDAPIDDVPKTNGSSTRAEPAVENGGGADGRREESPQRLSEDSDNASENIEVSGSDSGEECFRENDEEAKNGGIGNKAESEGEAEGMDDTHEVDGEGNSVPNYECILSNVKPLVKHVPHASKEQKRDSRVFYGNDSLYVLLRLHRTLYERIQSAKINSSSAEKKWKTLNDDCSTDQYARFMSALYSLLDGSSDNTKFEDDCRAIIGTQSYVLFTLDKLIFRLVKQLQTVASDEMDSKLLQLYAYESSRKPERFVDSVYHENARVLLYDGNIYRMECLSSPCQLSIQIMDHGHEKPEITAVSIDPNFSSYLHDDFLGATPDKKQKSGILMKRNRRGNPFGDESVLEEINYFNGLECKITCKTSKVSYVLDTEDLLYRSSRAKRALCPHKKDKLSAISAARSHRFNKFQIKLIGD